MGAVTKNKITAIKTSLGRCQLKEVGEASRGLKAHFRNNVTKIITDKPNPRMKNHSRRPRSEKEQFGSQENISYLEVP